MPTKRPRVQVTTTPEVIAALTALNGLTGKSQSLMVAELLQACLPALEMSIQALQVVKEQPREAERLMAAYTAQSIHDVTQEQLEFSHALDGRTMKAKIARRKHASP